MWWRLHGPQVMRAPDGTSGATPTGEGVTSGSTLTPEAMDKWMGGITTLDTSIKELVALAKAGPARSEPEVETEPPEAPAQELDWDSLTNKELAQEIVRAVTGEFGRMLDPVTQQITGLQQSLTQKEMATSIQSLQGQHKDYWEWKDEMVELAKQHPTMTPIDVYTLAKARDPAKAEKLAQKHAPASTTPRRPTFGGLAPGNTGQTQRTRAVSTEDALETAWSEVEARHGNILSNFGRDD